MADSPAPAPRRKKRPPEPETLHPWLQLLELEISEPKPPPQPKQRGRRPNRVPRSRVMVTLTANEKARLDEVVELLSRQFGSKKVIRGNVIGFLLLRLVDALETSVAGHKQLALPEKVKSLRDLAAYLDEQGK